MMDVTVDIMENEQEIAAYIDTLTSENLQQAEDFCTLFLKENDEKLSSNKAVSAAFARCVCRFLLHKKNKSRLADIIAGNSTIRTAVFGRLNTYKYSLIFIMKRVFRLNSESLTKEVLELLAGNPFRDDKAKSYARGWSLRFLIDETMKAPADYLNLSEESLKIINTFLKEGEFDEQDEE
jgi:hypothetical protein